MWKSFIDLLASNAPLISLLNVLLWAFYVFYTIRTFLQIRRQTELQSEAFLVVSSELLSGDKLASVRVGSEIKELYDKWFQILETNIPAARKQEQSVVLRLKNRGRSDITWWNIEVIALVDPGKYLSNKFNITGETSKWTIEHEGYKDIIAPDEKIDVLVAKTGVFPVVTFDWSIKYKDMRDVTYSRFGGDNSLVDRNVLADPQITP